MRRLALLALLALSSCPKPDAELARAVREYDDALVTAYASSDPSGMSRVATRKEADRVRVLIDLKIGAKLVLESTIEEFAVTSATVSGDTGTVETRERWRYHDRRLQPGAPPGPEIVSAMTMRYSLVRQDGRWKVASGKTLTNEYLTPAGKGSGSVGPGTNGSAEHR